MTQTRNSTPNPGRFTTYNSTTLNYQLFSRDSALVSDGSRNSGTGTIVYTPHYSGPMYVHVYTNSISIVEFGIRVENYPKDVTEPDNDMKSAALIKTDGTVSASLLSETDEDWVKFPAKAGTAYRVSWSAGDDIDTYLYNSDSTKLNSFTDNDSASLVQKANKDDTFYVRMRPYSSSTTTPFAVRVAVTPIANDSDEPGNNTLGGARLLATDSSVQHARIVLDDNDHFFFEAESGTTYVFDALCNTPLGYRILNSDSTVLQSSSYMGMFYWTAPESGKYFLCMQGANTSYINDYSLTAMAYKPDSYEKDNKLSSASPIASDGTPQSRVLLSGDDDWISVAVDSGVVYTLHYTGSNTVYNEIYSDDSLVLYQKSTISSGDTRTFTIKRKCNMFVRFQSYVTYPITNYQIWITKPED